MELSRANNGLGASVITTHAPLHAQSPLGGVINLSAVREIEYAFASNLAVLDATRGDFSEDDFRSAIESRLRKRLDDIARAYLAKSRKRKEQIYTAYKEGVVRHILNSIEPENLGLAALLRLHDVLFPAGVWGKTMDAVGNRYDKLYPAGVLRDCKELVDNSGEIHYYPDPDRVPVMMDALLTWYQAANGKIHPVVRLLLFVVFIGEIHPFFNGNSVTYLLVTEYLLRKMGYQASIIRVHDSINTADLIRFYTDGVKGHWVQSVGMFLEQMSEPPRAR